MDAIKKRVLNISGSHGIIIPKKLAYRLDLEYGAEVVIAARDRDILVIAKADEDDRLADREQSPARD